MEAMRMTLFAAVVMMLIAVAAAQDSPASAPAPGPTSGAATFGPAAALTSVLALAFGFLY